MKVGTALIVIFITLTYVDWSVAQPQITIDQVGFHLFTSENPKDGQELKINDTELLNSSKFNKDWPVRFIIHGYESSKDSSLNPLIRDAYFKKGSFNVISVDWSACSTTVYAVAASQVTPVGKIVGQFTQFLNREGVDFDNMYLIGHSLGAHIAGMAGHTIAPEQYNTIFALDPARPGFEFISVERKIEPSDAKYVESIQTNTNIIGVGMMSPAGRASFFPNYQNYIQPGCTVISCSHTRSIEYFAESINSDLGFYGKCVNCSTYQQMGGEPSVHKEGVFYLVTNPYPPYAKGKCCV